MTQRSVSHTNSRKAHGAISAPPLAISPENPDPSEIARVRQRVRRYGRKGSEHPEIHRKIWRARARSRVRRGGRGEGHIHEAAKHDGCEENDHRCGSYGWLRRGPRRSVGEPISTDKFRYPAPENFRQTAKQGRIQPRSENTAIEPRELGNCLCTSISEGRAHPLFLYRGGDFSAVPTAR